MNFGARNWEDAAEDGDWALGDGSEQERGFGTGVWRRADTRLGVCKMGDTQKGFSQY